MPSRQEIIFRRNLKWKDPENLSTTSGYSRHLFQKSTVPAMLVYLKQPTGSTGRELIRFTRSVHTSYFKWMGKKEPCETNQTLGTFLQGPRGQS